ANQCAVALLAGTNLNSVSVNQGKLFGSFLFEYKVTVPNDPKNLTKAFYILIWLNNSQSQTLQLTGEAYDWLFQLLCCRHKILYIYQQACNCYPEAKGIYSYLEKKIKEFTHLITDSQIQLQNSSNELLVENATKKP
ncbi:MAG: hypothetical protein HC780_25785, partial [Leptolyngbyaceae cyanobacterium CSU_1_3]|nr:hypothetical protein [Leptolyngbyaceae cyanobacterium CSU_1_3]